MLSNVAITDNSNETQSYITKLEIENAELKERIAWFERQVFGQKSERYIAADTNQTELDLGISPCDEPTEEETIGPYKRQKKKVETSGHGREEFPAHIPRKREEIKPDFDTSGMKKIGEKVTEVLEYRPPVFFVRQIVRGVWATTDFEPEIKSPSLPPRAVEKGKLGASVLSQLIVEKCLFHTPLQRLSKKWKMEIGYSVSESTLYDNFAASCFWLQVIEREILKKIVNSGYVQMDESTLRVLIKGKTGKSKKGYMWVAHAPELKLVVFTYRNSRNAKGPVEILGEEYAGILQTDGYNGYNPFCNNNKNVERIGCFAHTRRGFENALRNDKALAEKGLDFHRQIFDIEKQALNENMEHDQRMQLRVKKTKPILDELKPWLTEQIKETTPSSKIGKAVRYMMNQWLGLTPIIEHGNVEISNNWVENVIRLLAIGRKNFMFAGSENGAKNLATAYSVIATCKKLDINPFDYIRTVLTELPKRSADDIEDLMPWNFVSHEENIVSENPA